MDQSWQLPTDYHLLDPGTLSEVKTFFCSIHQSSLLVLKLMVIFFELNLSKTNLCQKIPINSYSTWFCPAHCTVPPSIFQLNLFSQGSLQLFPECVFHNWKTNEHQNYPRLSPWIFQISSHLFLPDFSARQGGRSVSSITSWPPPLHLFDHMGRARFATNHCSTITITITAVSVITTI